MARFFRFHLITLILCVLFAGVLVWLNFIPFRDELPPFLGWELLWDGYHHWGWPFTWRKQLMARGPPGEPLSCPEFLVLDVIVCLGITLVFGMFVEWVVRYPSKKGPNRRAHADPVP